jgi:MoxR-like ATPase
MAEATVTTMEEFSALKKRERGERTMIKSGIDKLIESINSGVLSINEESLREMFDCADKDKFSTMFGDKKNLCEILMSTGSVIFRLQAAKVKVELMPDKSGLRVVGSTSDKKATVAGKSGPVEKEIKVEVKPVVEPLDPAYYEIPDIFPVIEDAIKNRDVVYLYGMPGSGKNFMYQKIAEKHNMVFTRQQMIGDMSKEDFLGYYEFKSGETRFVDGKLIKCMKEGKFLSIDEIELAPNEIIMILQKMLEKNADNTFKTLYNPMNGEEVMPHEDFRLACTGNTCGKGDETSLFSGTHPMNDAFLDRFPIVYKLDYPTQKVERKILMKTVGVTEKQATDIVMLAAGVRNAFKNQKIYSTFSMRRSHNLAILLKRGMAWNQALQLTVIDRMGGADAIAVMEISGRINGYSESQKTEIINRGIAVDGR